MNKLDDFDKFLKEKAHNDTFEIPEILDKKIDIITRNLPERKKYKKVTAKVLMVASLAILMTVTTVIASSTSLVKERVNQAISYFNDSSETKYLTDKASFEKFNKEVGVSYENEGIEFTVDNIAVDDNFLIIFSTIKSEEVINMDFADENKFFEDILSMPSLNFRINGKKIDIANNNGSDAYFQGDKILKAMYRVNLSQMKLPDNFDLEISTDRIFKIDGKWEIVTSIDKSDIAVETRTVEPKIKAKVDLGDFQHKITIDKVSISPFGSQIVISENVKKDRFFENFILFDQKGDVLDLLNGDRSTKSFGKSTNSFEFIKADMDTEHLTLVPLKYVEEGTGIKEEKQSISKLPIKFETFNEGNLVVEKIEFDKNMIKISYYKEGVVLWDPLFFFCDNDGRKLDLGDCGSSTSIDKKKGKYTQILNFGDKYVDSLNIKQIGTFVGYNIELLEKQQIKIDMQK
ncbi:DUF4179 domain-containing protein [Clostridium sediminicola]|uniref:DUF4179 domain-containing protein n=1 Tax=Clostridium sediminicola TaxID=3114879 RepID=UPI0031F1E7EA